MTNEIVNTDQTKLWEGAGPFWLQEQEQLDRQLNLHNLRGIDAANPSSGEMVLDVGCGTGTSTFQIAERVGPGGSVVGADISSTMVDAANGRAEAIGTSNVSFVVADAQIHQHVQPFNLVYSRFGLMFFDDPPAAFANIRAALKPTGRIAFVCWQTPAKNPSLSLRREAVLPLLPATPAPAPGAPGPFSLADPDKIRALLASAGFSSVSVEGSDAKANLGTNLDEATDSQFAIFTATANLDATDPPLAKKARAAIREAMTPFLGPNGVEMDSATWIVTARA